MQFLVIDGCKTVRIDSESKAAAAAKYGRIHLPKEARSKLYRLRVLDISLASEFTCLVTRHVDSIQATAKEVDARWVQNSLSLDEREF